MVSWGNRYSVRPGRIVAVASMCRRNPARLEVSPYDSSYKISGDSPNHDKVNYYPTEWILETMFDIEPRSRTAEEDRWMTWNERFGICARTQPGFGEEEIRRHLLHFGGLEWERFGVPK